MTLNPPVSIFVSYSRKDEDLMRELRKHLDSLKLEGWLSNHWYDGLLLPGEEWDQKIKQHLEQAEVILLLISADFISSDYCYKVELAKAIERHQAGDAAVIPIILRPCRWESIPVGGIRLGQLQALPSDAKPITKWVDADDAFINIVEGLCKKIQQLHYTKTKGEEYYQSGCLNQQQGNYWQSVIHLTQAKQYGHPNAEYILAMMDDMGSEKGVDYRNLRYLLAAQNWHEADKETFNLMKMVLNQNWSSQAIMNFPCKDLLTIDRLWVKYSNGKYGFSVQKAIYLQCGGVANGIYYKEAWERFHLCNYF